MEKIFFKLALLAFMGMLCFFLGCTREKVQQYAAIEQFPEDQILKSIDNKRAAIVLAHDDDMCALSGTASWLNKMGWEIGVISFSKNPKRNEAQIKACQNILDTVLFVDLKHEQIRNDLNDGHEPYAAISKDDFNQVFNLNLIEKSYTTLINQLNPTVIFTLDNEIGGYGHPEHVMISQMVLDLAKQGNISPSYVYQSVYTDHMETKIMGRHARRMKSWGFDGDGWEKAKSTYTVDGMPEPTVQINIESEAKEKMQYLKSYNERERKTIGFFVPAFEDYTAEEYFKIFNREFFRIIDLNRAD